MPRILFACAFLFAIVGMNAAVVTAYHPALAEAASHVGWTAFISALACGAFGLAALEGTVR